MSNELLAPGVSGVTGVVPALTQWSVSPGDTWVALALAEATSVVVLELATGRVTARIPGAEVLGLAWTSPEGLIVLRAQARGGRAVLHAMPDGAAVASVALPNLHGGGHTVSAAGGVVAVLPRRWHGGLAQRVRRRVGYVLRAEPLEALREVVPSEWSAVPSLPHARATVAGLEPDGHALTVWLGEPNAQGALGDALGHLVRYRWDDDRALRLARAGRDVSELLCCDPTRVVLRGACGDELASRGELSVVDTERGMVLWDASMDDDALGPWATMDLDLDREKLLVAGRAMKGPRGAGTLRVLDVAHGTQPQRHVELSTSPERAVSAVWADDGARAWVLTSPSASVARVRPWRSLREGPEGAGGWDLALRGARPSRGRLAWSPSRTRLMVSWRATPARGDAAAKALGVTQLAWIETAPG